MKEQPTQEEVKLSRNAKRAIKLGFDPDDVAKNLCAICKTAYPSEDYLIRHIRRVHVEKRFLCSQCSFRTHYDVNLRKHVEVHHKGIGYICGECGAVFRDKKGHTNHVRTHTGERPFKCSLCEATFSDKANCRRHEKLSHGTSDVFTCLECFKTFSMKSSLDMHMKIHRGQKDHKCELCHYATSNGSNLKRHIIEAHTKAYPHSCERCKKGFAEKWVLKKHLMSCSQARTRRATKRQPQPPVVKERPKCPECGKTFRLTANLTIHLKIHRGQKDRKCEFCDYATSNGSNLKRHIIQNHTWDYPHICCVCQKGFCEKWVHKTHQERCLAKVNKAGGMGPGTTGIGNLPTQVPLPPRMVVPPLFPAPVFDEESGSEAQQEKSSIDDIVESIRLGLA